VYDFIDLCGNADTVRNTELRWYFCWIPFQIWYKADTSTTFKTH